MSTAFVKIDLFSSFDPFGSGKILRLWLWIKRYILGEASYNLLSRNRARSTLRISLSRDLKLSCYQILASISESLHGTVSSRSYSNGFFLRAVDFSNWFKKIYQQKLSINMYKKQMKWPWVPAILGQNQNRKRSPSYRGLSVDWLLQWKSESGSYYNASLKLAVTTVQVWNWQLLPCNWSWQLQPCKYEVGSYNRTTLKLAVTTVKVWSWQLLPCNSEVGSYNRASLKLAVTTVQVWSW